MLEHNRIKLEHQLKEHGFEHALNYLTETTRQGVRCAKTGKTDYTKPGRSRVGGDPDLPPTFAWPLASDGTPMTFLIQRAQLSTHLLAGESPVAGGAKPPRS